MSETIEIKTTDEGRRARQAGVRALYETAQAMTQAYNADAEASNAPEEQMATVDLRAYGDLTETERVVWDGNADQYLYGIVSLFSQFSEWVKDGHPEQSSEEKIREALKAMLSGGVPDEGATVEGNYL